MKGSATILGLVFWVLSLRAEVPPLQTVRAAWDYSNPTGFVFYVKQRAGLATNTIAVVTNANHVTISNVVPSQYEWSVTASNMWGESDPSVPFITPAKPVTPGQLKPITTTMRVKLPVTVELSQDLATWDEKWRWFKINDQQELVVMHTFRPSDPFQFMMVKPDPQPGMPR